jgi:hypothetical protein
MTQYWTAFDLAETFLTFVFSKHGIPLDVISDRGSKFVSLFWKEFCKIVKIQQHLSTAYHPQSDGQTERINQILEQYLRIYVQYDQDDWCRLLPMAEFVYNNTYHSTTQVTPFFANKGYHPILNIDITTARQEVAKEYVSDLQQLHSFLQSQIKKANEVTTHYANKKRQAAPTFIENDMVWLSTENLKLRRPMRKLSEKRIGPFKIKKVISRNAMQLDLPTNLQALYPVFHVSLLEPYRPNPFTSRIQPPPPPIEIDGELEYEVEDIVDYKIKRNKKQYLVKWVGYEGKDQYTWEPQENVQHLDILIQRINKKKSVNKKQRA